MLGGAGRARELSEVRKRSTRPPATGDGRSRYPHPTPLPRSATGSVTGRVRHVHSST